VDPPYNVSKRKRLRWRFSRYVTINEAWDEFSKDEFFAFNQRWLAECTRVLKPGGSLWMCGSFHNIYQIRFILHQLHPEMRINNSIVWFKPNGLPNITRRMFTESCEHLIWAAKKGKSWNFNYAWTKSGIEDLLNPQGKQTRNVWPIPTTPKNEKWAGRHPSQKPVELLRRIILSCTSPGDLVLDPFAGSGTTAVTSQNYGRSSISIEKRFEYVALIRKRLRVTK
jgi:site-specific DNA-methyltransferase (adenine-specific)